VPNTLPLRWERWRGSMRGEIIYPYQKLNSADQKVFRRWLWANTIVGAILLAGLIALAVNVPGDKSEATAQHATIYHKLPPERASILPSH
jgi:hypothetical protein